MRPDDAIEQLPGLVLVAIFVERRTARQDQRDRPAADDIGGGKRGDLRVRPVPPEVVGAAAELGFVHEAGTDRPHVADSHSQRVLVEAGDEVFVRRPDEVRAGQPRDRDPAHEAVYAVAGIVIEPLDRERPVDRNRRSDCGRCGQVTAVGDCRARELLE